jgi:hypothetical protein
MFAGGRIEQELGAVSGAGADGHDVGPVDLLVPVPGDNDPGHHAPRVARRRQRVSERAAASAAADDNHVIVLGHQTIVEAPGALVITRQR